MTRSSLLAAALAIALFAAAPSYAGTPGIAKPFDTVGPPAGAPLGSGGTGTTLLAGSLTAALQAGADHVITFQCADGGWGWPEASCPTTTYHNITAPIASGLLDAYTSTNDIAHLNAATAAGNFDLTSQYGNGEARFGAFTASFFLKLSGMTADTTWSDFAAVSFFDELTAATYGPSDLDTAGWIASVQAGRAGAWVNLLPWEFHNLIDTSAAIGNTGQDALFLQGLLDGLNTLDNSDPANVWSDIIGLAGAVSGLARSGVTTFTAINSPNHSLINGINNLQDLANVLAGLQNANGSWYWHSNLGAPTTGDEDTQTTAYAVIALAEACSALGADYGPNVATGRDWLLTMQLGSGGFMSWPGGTENSEVEGEALSALRAAEALLRGDTCADALDIASLPFTESGDTSCLTNALTPPAGCAFQDNSNAPDVVYSYTPGANENVNISLCNGPADSVLVVYNDAACNDAAVAACNDDGTCAGGGGGNFQSEVVCLALTGGTTYYIDVDMWGSAGMPYTLDVSLATGACCNRISGTCSEVEEANCSGPDDEWNCGVACADLNPPCVPAPRGACCNRTTYVCQDNSLARDCAGFNQDWTDGVLCADLASPCQPPPPSIPTVTEWGLFLMTLLGCALGTILFRRTRAVKME